MKIYISIAYILPFIPLTFEFIFNPILDLFLYFSYIFGYIIFIFILYYFYIFIFSLKSGFDCRSAHCNTSSRRAVCAGGWARSADQAPFDLDPPARGRRAWQVCWGIAKDKSVFKEPTVLSIAAAHNVSAAQVALRWIVQRGDTFAVLQ